MVACIGNDLENFKKLIGKKIRARRKEMGFATQAALAEKLGVDQSRVGRWETGENLPDASFKADLLRVLAADESLFDIEPDGGAIEKVIGLLVMFQRAPEARRLCALYLLSDNSEYLESLRKLPNAAPIALALSKLPRAR